MVLPIIIGVIPSKIIHGSVRTNGENDVGYKYVESKAKGTIIFENNYAPGNYDFRLHDKQANGKELTFISFK